MRVTVLGAGIIGVSAAWHLLERGHEVTLVDRQADAALETSFGNAAQISVSYCEPWANREAPLKALKWMFDPEGPLKFRPQLDPAQWKWGLQFLAQCNDTAFERNVAQLVALGQYSHSALKAIVASTGIQYHRLTKGIAHYYTSQQSFDDAGSAAEVMRRQRGVAYVSSVTRTWRKAIDQVIADEAHWQLKPEWQAELSRHAEGHQTTLGPYHRAWH